MASTTTAAADHCLSAQMMGSSSSVDEDDDMLHGSLYGGSGDSAAANKRRKQTKPIRFSAAASEENGGVDVLDLSKAQPPPTAPSSSTRHSKQQRPGGQGAPGAAVLDLCVKPNGTNSLKPHNDNHGDALARKRRISGPHREAPVNRKPGGVVEQFTCTLCHMSFAARPLLQKHMKDSHGVTLPDQPAPVPAKSRSKARPKVKAEGHSQVNGTGDATSAAALAQALLMPGASGSAASTQGSVTTSSSGINPALAMLLPYPWAGVLPPESISKLLQLGGNGANLLLQNGANPATPPTSSSPALGPTTTTGRSNPTPPSSSGRSSPREEARNWEEGSPNMSALGHLPLLGFEEGLDGAKPADSLLRSTVAARMADRVECDICHKQVCNKYFLKSHKLKIHGIAPTDSPAQSSGGTKKTPSAASPSPPVAPTANNDAPPDLATAGLQLPVELLNSLFRSPAVKAEVDAASQPDVDSKANLFSGSALLRPPSPIATSSSSALNLAPATPAASSGIDLSVRRSGSQPEPSARAFGSPSGGAFASSQPASSFSPYMPPIPGIAPGGIPPPGWRPGSTWRWKETSSISRVTCDICGKELCNKYFLRTHKQNRHGIKDETKSAASDNSSSSKKKSSVISAATTDSVPSGGLAGLLEQPKVETARCRCSECGKRFLSPIVYRRHMAFCHSVAVVIGEDLERFHQSQRPGVVVNKLKRQSRNRQLAWQRLSASREESASSHLPDYGVDSVDDDAVTFQIVATKGSSGSPDSTGGDSQGETEFSTADLEGLFDWPQALGVFLKKRKSPQLDKSSSESSDASPSFASPVALPTTLTLTLKLQERKADSYKGLRPAYLRSGELVAVPSSGLDALNNHHQPEPTPVQGESSESVSNDATVADEPALSTDQNSGMDAEQAAPSPVLDEAAGDGASDDADAGAMVIVENEAAQ